MPESSDVPRRAFRLHRLSLKLALAGAAVTAGLWGGLGLFSPLPSFATGLLLSGLTGLALYGVAHRLLAARLELAHTTLRQIRRHEFDNLEAAHLPKGDELGGLLWEVYRTGEVLEKDFREFKKVENYRREFLGNVSHELKTPIFSIRGFAETLLEGALENEAVRRTFVEKILRNANRLSNLASDLAEISRIETGELKMTVEPFDLHRVVRDVIELLEPIAVEKPVTLRSRLPERLAPVLGDGNHIRQVLINLVENAIKYNNPGGYVELVAEPSGPDEVRIAVIDNGIGIAPQHIPRVTERFYRVDKSRSRAQGGTGLGLAIVKHILGAHGRTLLIESMPGRGSTFSFTLPLAVTQPAARRSPAGGRRGP
ncbi:MAG: two-component sensor histidine kinase [Rhodothermaceae bacterium]|nr:MAG: two-component sensor histidine kinase [Rhodothermaceae bacterium]